MVLQTCSCTIPTEQAVRNPKRFSAMFTILRLSGVCHKLGAYPLRDDVLPALLVNTARNQQGMRPEFLVRSIMAGPTTVPPSQQISDLIQL